MVVINNRKRNKFMRQQIRKEFLDKIKLKLYYLYRDFLAWKFRVTK
jgi:hypothetical protein